MHIRHGTPADTDALVDLLVAGWDEVGFVTPDRDRIRAQVIATLETGIVTVAELDGEVVGSIGAMAQQWWYSQDRYIADVWTFVHPKARKTRAARLLLKSVKETAKLLRLPLVMGLFNEVDLVRKVKLYERSGLRPVGMFFWQEA